MKICSKCLENKKLTEFAKRQASVDGLAYQCKECNKKAAVKSNKDTPDRHAKHVKKWQENNWNKHLNDCKKYRDNNGGKRRAWGAKRRALELKATPTWLVGEQLMEIESFYILARELEQKDGIKRHVDHIVPLQGKRVTGLHVPWNLQILTAKENVKKSNKYEES